MGMSANSPPGMRRAAEAMGRDRREDFIELADVKEVEVDGVGRKASTARTTPSGPSSSPELGSRAVTGEELDGSGKGDEEPHCMFVANCDTGSQLRKAISHLFGRNKSCTLKIPKEVWVYYCRKHYKRIRYRNARTYPSNQMELVNVQIRRLQAWSESNKAKGDGPQIKQWTLSLRKREQNRLENGKGAVDEGDDDQGAASQGGSVVPEWIIQLVGDDYTTDKMLEIAERLHKDISEGALSQVPEIEFLPDIVDEDEGASAKPTRGRRQNSSSGGFKTPKRKAGDFPAMARHNSLYEERASPEHQAGQQLDRAEGLTSPSGKRPCIDRLNEVHYGFAPAHAYVSVPPRALNVVPKCRSLEYGQAVRADELDRPGRGRLSPSHHGFDGAPHWEEASSAYGQHAAVRFRTGHGSGHGEMRLTLPSISTHMSAGVAGYPQAPMAGPPLGPTRRRDHGVVRPSHQRSASAFTPLGRFAVAASTRPYSSGNGANVAAGARLGHGGGGGDARIELEPHGPASAGGSHRPHQPYSQEQAGGWAAGYSLALGPPSCGGLFQQPMLYGQATGSRDAEPALRLPYDMGGAPAIMCEASHDA